MPKTIARDRVTPLSANGRRCPVCGKSAAARHQPFCSTRCANIDLGRWLNGNYRIAGDEPPEEAADPNES